MSVKTFFLMLAAFFLISGAAGTTISEEKIIIDLEDNSVNVEMEVEELTTESFNYQTKHRVRNLRGYFNGEEMPCSADNLPLGSNINCDTDLRQNFTVRLEYRASGLVNQEEKGIRKFTYNQSIYRPIQNYSLRVLLPEGTGLVDPANASGLVTSPEGADIDNINGRRFSVDWNLNPDLGPANFHIFFEKLDREQSTNYLPHLIGLSILIIVSIIAYRRKIDVKTSNILEELTEDQKMVVDMLRDKDGEMLQKDIVDKSDYSKAKISGVVKELEDLDIITKEKEGRSNKVKLQEEFKN